jgi:hypothetical protein
MKFRMIRRAGNGRIRWILVAAVLSGILPLRLIGQTTQGLISGRVRDRSSTKAIPGSSVFYCRIADDNTIDRRGSTRADEQGYYVLPSLSPGDYRLRAQLEAASLPVNENECFPAPETNPKFQAQEKHDLTLAVAARMEVDFDLRPAQEVSDPQAANYLTPRGLVIRYFGADGRTMKSITVDTGPAAQQTGGSTVSYVVDPRSLERLPLAGRDIYTTLIMQPGVTADTATSRGIGLSVNGQRPTASNFLLDGVENNNYLVTGPLVTAAPEAIQEYRISTNSFTAEYGGTAGVLANAVTRAGGTRWHGLGYVYAKNDALNANDFQRNRMGQPRPQLHETEPGIQAGGPIRANRFFTSTSFEYFRSRGFGYPVTVILPTTGFVNYLAGLTSNPATAAAATALNLLQSHPWPAPNSKALTAPVTVSLPSFANRSQFLERLDYTPTGGVHHLMGRVASARVKRPQFIWSPYQGFDSPLRQNTLSSMAALTSNLGPRRVSEARLSWSNDELSWDRAHPEIATLTSLDGALLPGSLSAYAYKNHSRTFEFTGQFVWAHGPHLVKLGGGVLLRSLDGFLSYGRDGRFLFTTIQQFAQGAPSSFDVSVDRTSLPKLQIPSFDRQYTYNQFHFFAQDTYRVTPRLTLNYGMRYENFGAPRGTGAVKEVLLKPGAPGAEIAGAQLLPEAAGQSIYARDNRGWAARLGGSYNLTSDGRRLLHGGSGIFYDRPYDNLWRNVSNNNFSLAEFFFATPIANTPTANYLAPASQVLSQFAGKAVDSPSPLITWIDARIRNTYVWTSFLGVQQEFARHVTLELNGMETLGRRLISTDVLNRGSNTNEALPEISYRANQGSANYSALTALLRYRTSSIQFQAAYTWSHNIDNQSSPLAGDFFDLSFVSLTATPGYQPRAAFSRAGDLRVDRGNSDFDQRQNLVLMWTAAIPSPRGSSRAQVLLRDWKLSGLAALRTGFPYSIYAGAGAAGIINRRGDLVDQAQAFIDQPATGGGGRLLLSPAAFAAPSTPIGNIGRNAIAGPGLYNADLSVSRSVAVRNLGESGRIELRADLFNALNHANLGNPDSTIGSGFGVALYGRKPAQSGFPGLIPLTETARQIQVMVRVRW